MFFLEQNCPHTKDSFKLIKEIKLEMFQLKEMHLGDFEKHKIAGK